MNWPAEIKKIRRLRGLKQQALADLIHVSRGSVARWEAGFDQPNLLAQKKLKALFAERSSVDRTLKNLIDTSPVMMELLRPDT
jgi:DNA-binding transcriptional regulator YiaG